MKRWNPFGGTTTQPTPAVTPVAPLPVDIPHVVTPPDAKYFGLENFGNTCYANSVLQALYYCGPFRELVLQYPDPSVPELPPTPPPVPATTQQTKSKTATEQHSNPVTPSQAGTPAVSANGDTSPTGAPTIPSTPPTLLSALRSLYIHISRNPADKGTVAPRAFIDKLKELNELFRTAQHQDAHEFLNFLLNRILEEMEDDRRKGVVLVLNGVTTGATPSKEDLSQSISSLNSSTGAPPPSTITVSTSHPTTSSTFVHRLFEGILTSETRCLTCETVSSRDESFLDLSIDIEQNASVTACLRQFSASEMLCQKNKFFCDSCCDLQEAEKRMKIKKLPNVLALHLKRFKYQEDTGRYVKLAYRVAFPFQLRLFNTVDDAENPDRLYELFAIVVHIGAGPHHGHYVSIIKARGTWYLFDDDNVDTIKESDIAKYYGDNNGSAYVLYYQATDLDVTALGLRPPPSATPSPLPTASLKEGPSSVRSVTSSEAGFDEVNLPALPPGLVQSPEQPPNELEATPALPNAQGPQLLVTIPPTSSDSNPSTPTAPATPNTLNTIFRSIRHSPSGKIKKHILDVVKSEPPPPLPTAPVSASSIELPSGSTPVSSVADPSVDPYIPPPTPTMMINGKEREPERKPSGWFSRRKSVRDEKTKIVPSSFPSLGDSGNSNWFKHPGRLGRRTSDVGLHNSPSAASVPSSPRLDPIPSPPRSPVVPFNSATLHAPPDHKKSAPELSNGRKRLPQRPSTANATMSSSSSRPRSVATPPLPPLPSSPSALNGQRRVSPLPNDLLGSPLANSHSDRGTNGTSAPSFEVKRASRPQSSSSAVNPGLGFSTSSNGTASTLNTSSHSGEGSGTSTGNGPPPTGITRKRASRKLSFTGQISMLGFGRKDRDKGKDKTVSSPPITYSPGTVRDR
ncbi:hypothetical protein QCA50_010073 [Cerrena zonata]|uniref:Ubiquitin carboxyl-terminal hydrolase n=1 Tax=Cerrena zonata TaxID=2478898 RepID=A0AAW0G4N1_9APHY